MPCLTTLVIFLRSLSVLMPYHILPPEYGNIYRLLGFHPRIVKVRNTGSTHLTLFLGPVKNVTFKIREV